MKKLLYIALALLAAGCANNKQTHSGTIKSGAEWFDTDGNIINAHGGGIMEHDGRYYWYGECKGDSTTRLEEITSWECYRAPNNGVTCYSSDDLIHWKFEGMALAAEPSDTTSELHPSQVIERPKVIYNDRTGKFVMWLHIESPDYQKAHAGVAVSDSPVGPFKYIGSVRPNGEESRDQTIFKDDDGRAYHFHSSEDNATLHICPLNDDYTAHTGEFIRVFEGERREAPAVFKHNGRYYMITSGCTGWDPNVAQWAWADSIMGEWHPMGNPCIGPDAENTYHAQSTFVLPLPGQPDRYLAMFDRWCKTDLKDSRYVWLPLTFKGEEPVVEWADEWTIE